MVSAEFGLQDISLPIGLRKPESRKPEIRNETGAAAGKVVFSQVSGTFCRFFAY
jgi:hypothetical protein